MTSYPRLWVLSVLASSFAVVAGCTGSAPPPPPPPTQQAPLVPPSTPTKASPKPDLKPTDEPADFGPVSAEALAKEFVDNDESASKKYGGKSVIVEGTVAEKTGEPPAVVLILNGYKGAKETVQVECRLLTSLDKYTEARSATVKPGDKVKVRVELVTLLTLPRRSGQPAVLSINFGKLLN